MSTLYVVATPIGNLSDISKRALDTLNAVKLIASEDTRIIGKLLSHYNIKTRKISFNKDNAANRLPELLSILEDSNIALTCDAGTPGISDPGFQLVAAARNNGHKTLVIPGPSAVISAISLSPIPINSFLFAGFAPKKTSDLEKLLYKIDNLDTFLLLFEAPHRFNTFLSKINKYSPNRLLFITRELTKIYEDSFLGTAKESIDYFVNPKGEFTIIISPMKFTMTLNKEDSIKLIMKLQSDGLGIKEISKEIATVTQLSNSDAYKLILDTL